MESNTRQLVNYYVEKAESAIESVEVISKESNYIRGYSDCSSFEIQVTESKIQGSQPGSFLIVVFEPSLFKSAYPIASKLHPTYFVEKFGNRGNNILDYHGGDTFTVLEAIKRLTGIDYYGPRTLFNLYVEE